MGWLKITHLRSGRVILDSHEDEVTIAVGDYVVKARPDRPHVVPPVLIAPMSVEQWERAEAKRERDFWRHQEEPVIELETEDEGSDDEPEEDE